MKLPIATYRIQLHADFGLRAAADVLDYLHALGVSDLYASPVFEARKGSTHGYDVEDPRRFNPELGDDSDREALFQRLQELEMGWVQDIVPNHMAYSGNNPFLSDLLENGPRSPFYDFFDIQWDHPDPELNGAVCAPFLGEPLEVCLGKGDIGVGLTEQGLQVKYYQHRFPITLDAYPQVLCPGGECATEGASASGEEELRGGVDRLLQSARLYDPQARQKALTDAKRGLWSLYTENDRVRALVDGRIRLLNKDPLNAGLDDLLARQYFRLRHWTTAGRKINYRRFFDINGLITLRQELPEVFEQTHHLIKQLVRDGLVTGLRIDHIDGLFDPAGYLKRLRDMAGDVYIVAEKILDADEPLPEDWPVQGTSGYEFAVQMNALFCNPDSASQMTRLYAQITGTGDDFTEIGRRCKAKVLNDQFSGDLDNLVRRWEAAMKAGEGRPQASGKQLRDALAEMLTGLPVYRTYLASSERQPDLDLMEKVISASEARRPDLAGALGEIKRWLTQSREPRPSRTGKWMTAHSRQNALGAFEQLAAPLTAKGIEDTALYRYNRLAALNEVGGDPERFGAPPQTFHHFAALRQEKWPHALNTLSTHDTKRSADVRARMLALSELPDEWADRLAQFRTCNAPHVGRTDQGPAPEPEMEYLLYQTLAATWPRDRALLPEYRGRIETFMLKAAREAKQRTSWLEPEQPYEQALSAFLEKILDPAEGNDFTGLMEPFAERLAHYGFFNALSQTLIHLTAPGIPDIYQGNELFDDSLVDPDNRRPVDFQKRRRYLAEIEKGYRSDPAALVKTLMDHRFDGRIKLFTTWIALKARRQYARLFNEGGYLPLAIEGPKQRHAVAFARTADPHWSLTIVPRLTVGLAPQEQDISDSAVWSGTTVQLPAQAPAQWRNWMTGEPLQAVEHLPLSRALTHLPVALIIGESRP